MFANIRCVAVAVALGHCWGGVGRIVPQDSAGCTSTFSVRVLSIGVSQYAQANFAAPFAARDATAISAAFRTIGAELPVTLTGAAATRGQIEHALATLTQEAKSCDTVVFFFAGWGNAASGSFYLYPADVATDIVSQGISSSVLGAWLDKIQAQNLLVILDTGDASEFLAETLRHDLRAAGVPLDGTRRNLSVIAPQGNSWDDPKAEHGVLTYSVLQALSKDSDLDGDGLLSVSELEVATSANVIRANAGRPPEASFRARAVSVGNDFPIGRVGEAEPAPAMRGTRTYAQQHPAPPPTLKGRYRALLIATDEYKEWGGLKNPISDAEAIARELVSNYGFEKPTVLKNPTKREMSRALTEMRGWQFGPDDELFIFIAGHGTYDRDLDTGYLVASDSEKNDPGHDTYYSQFDMAKVIGAIPAQHILVVIDACQAGAGLAALRGDDPNGDIANKPGEKLQGLLRRKDRKSQLWLTSGGEDYVPDGEGNHSPFTYQFLRALASGANDPRGEGVLTFIDLLNYVQRVPAPAPQPTHGGLPKNVPGADFWFISRPDTRDQGTNSR